MSDFNDHIGDLKAEIENLKKSRDEALNSARSAMRDAARVTRLLMVLNERVPFDILLNDILSTLTELFSAEIVVIMDPAGTGHFSPIASVGLPENFFPDSVLLPESEMLVKNVMDNLVITSETVEGKSLINRFLRSSLIKTAVWIPMKGSGEPRGALILARCMLLPFANEEINLLSVMAYRIALTLEQIQHRNQLELIVRRNREIGKNLNESAIREEAIRTLPVLVGADSGVFFCNKDHFGFSMNKASCMKENLSPEMLAFSEGLCKNSAIINGEVLALVNSGNDPFNVYFSGSHYMSMLAVPIFRGNQLLCLLCAFRKNAVYFTEEMKQIASLYSKQIAIALENAYLYGVVQDELNERMQAEKSLRRSEVRFKALIHNISDIIAVLNPDSSIKFISESVITQWGCEPQALKGSMIFDRVHPEDLKTANDLMADALAKPGENIGRIFRLRAGEANAWRYFDVILTNQLNNASVEGIVSTFHDVTERMMVEMNLTELAFRDPLTGLANRAFFNDRVRYSLAHANELNISIGIIFFDLDDFKDINDTYGHAIGDATLCVVAERIRNHMRSNDLAARLGGDEFTVLIENIREFVSIKSFVDRFITNLQSPVKLSEIDISISGSIGIAISDPGVDDVDSLLKKADIAMYHAKRSGKGRYVVYEPALEERK